MKLTDKSSIALIEKKIVPLNLFEELKKYRILVIEDDEITALLLSILFKNAGIKGDIAKTGYDALQLIEIELYNIIFTDIQMPEMSGIVLLNAIRNHKRDSVRNLPVVALTANILAKNSLLEQGFNAFLSKPFKDSEFYYSIYSVINNGKVDVCLQKDNAIEMPKSSSYSFDDVLQFSGNDEHAIICIVHHAII